MLKQIYDTLRGRLSSCYPNEEARAIALRLLEHFTKLNTASILAHPELMLDRTIIENIMRSMDACLSGQPLQYGLGETEFYGHFFKVTGDVLIPRPETEELVDWILKDATLESPCILDIGTGSACIAVSLACALPMAQVIALDLSEKALQVAHENARLNAAKVHFIQHNMLSTYAIDLPSLLDVIVSNPPYICENERILMQDNVLLHEPHVALFVPNDRPLVFYQAIALFAQSHLKPSGSIYVEINENFGLATVALFKQAGFDAFLRKDLFGKDRMVKAVWG